MKRKYTKEAIVADIKVMDKRALTMSDEQIDMIINDGYSYIGMFTQLFSNEDVLEMAEYYDLGEHKLTIDIEDDTQFIYDLYGTVETVEPLRKVYNADAIYQDGRYTGRIHINLDLCETLDNVVIKYFYTPQATDLDIYVDAMAYSVMKQSFRVAIDSYLKDDKREAKSMSKLEGMCLNIVPDIPFDLSSRNY